MNEFERWPHVILQRGSLRLTVLLPDPVRGYYRGPRFDWSGMVALAEWKGHTFFGSWRDPPHRPRANDDAAGTAEELGMGPLTGNPAPPGYDDAAIGEAFLKIGVGRLVKVREPVYSFGSLYRMQRPAAWEIGERDGSISFAQEDGPLRGHSFFYIKRLTISDDGSGFEIFHRMENRGTSIIEQTCYCHNFLRIDDEPIGPSYSMELPFAPVCTQRASDVLRVEGNRVLVTRVPAAAEGYFALLEGFGASTADNSLIVRGARASVRIIGSEPLSRLQVFGTVRTICPEPFVRISIPPGSTKTWTTGYSFF